jgi:hypothetical protein
MSRESWNDQIISWLSGELAKRIPASQEDICSALVDMYYGSQERDKNNPQDGAHDQEWVVKSDELEQRVEDGWLNHPPGGAVDRNQSVSEEVAQQEDGQPVDTDDAGGAPDGEEVAQQEPEEQPIEFFSPWLLSVLALVWPIAGTVSFIVGNHILAIHVITGVISASGLLMIAGRFFRGSRES